MSVFLKRRPRTEQKSMSETPASPPHGSEDRAEKFGCGVTLLVAGGFMLAQQLGYIKGADWLFPAILLGWGATYIFGAMRKQ